MEGLREPESRVFNCDCIEYMHSLPDNYFNLVIADPPYGGGNDKQLGEAKNRLHKGGVFEKYHQPTNRFCGGTWAQRYKLPTMRTEGDLRDTGGGRSSNVGYYTATRVFR